MGRLGVVSLPAMSVGLDLDERVVRRHVSKLEAAGWLGRMPWVWGEGSVAWLTSAGIEAVGLGGLRSIKAPPSNTMTDHAVLVGWSAARLERRGRVWKSARELAVDSERWAVRTRCDRGYTTQLPDLVGWLSDDQPIAVVAESGFRREDRQKWILEGWRDAIRDGRYTGVRYDCTSESVAGWINRLAKKVWLKPPVFSAQVQPSAEELARLRPIDGTDDADAESDAHDARTNQSCHAPDQPANPEPVVADVAERPAVVVAPKQTSESMREPESPEPAAERERILRQVLGYDEPAPRRRWRRR